MTGRWCRALLIELACCGGTTTGSAGTGDASSSGTTTGAGHGASSTGGSSSGSSSSAGSSSTGSGSSTGGGMSGGTSGGASTCTNRTCTQSNSTCNVATPAGAEGSWDVYDNQWNCGPSSNCGSGPCDCGPETIYVCAAGSWYVTSDQPAGNNAVLSFPAVQDNFGTGNGVTISSFNGLTSTFTEQSPHVGDYEMAYDIWINGIANPPTSTEVMIWVDDYGQTPGGSEVGPATIGGQAYDVWASSDHSYLAFVMTTTMTSGTVDLLAVFNWVIAQGWMPSSSTLYQIGFGPEICSTGGQNATFYVNAFDITPS